MFFIPIVVFETSALSTLPLLAACGSLSVLQVAVNATFVMLVSLMCPQFQIVVASQGYAATVMFQLLSKVPSAKSSSNCSS
jgi:hypothetical protein